MVSSLKGFQSHLLISRPNANPGYIFKGKLTRKLGQFFLCSHDFFIVSSLINISSP